MGLDTDNSRPCNILFIFLDGDWVNTWENGFPPLPTKHTLELGKYLPLILVPIIVSVRTQKQKQTVLIQGKYEITQERE